MVGDKPTSLDSLNYEPSCKGMPYQQISIVAQDTIYPLFYMQRILCSLRSAVPLNKGG
jgi:hypothetical protein